MLLFLQNDAYRVQKELSFVRGVAMRLPDSFSVTILMLMKDLVLAGEECVFNCLYYKFA